MAYLHLIIDFNPIFDNGILYGATIDCARRTDTHVFADPNTSQLRNLVQVPLLIRRVAKSIRTNHTATVQYAAGRQLSRRCRAYFERAR